MIFLLRKREGNEKLPQSTYDVHLCGAIKIASLLYESEFCNHMFYRAMINNFDRL